MDMVRNGIKSFLQIQPASPSSINITETLDYEGNAVKNRVWYRGDSFELEQLYSQISQGIQRQSFWAAKTSPGMEINKIHTGLPAQIVDILVSVALASLNDFEFKDKQTEELWREIDEDNNFLKRLEKASKETLYIGDGAFKVTFDESISEYPIIEYYSGEKIELTINRGRVTEIIFKTVYEHKGKKYLLKEFYGYGYIRYKLFCNDKEVPLDGLEETKDLVDIGFSTYNENTGQPGEYMWAVPVMFFESGKWEGRGQSIYDRKIGAFDSLDETISQWMDALRAGRTKEYIPDCLLPKDPNTGKTMPHNAFDNRYIQTESDMHEGAKNQIDLKQPAIPHESYEATYIAALDLCLQGIISPSTLGIDVKKLDNADAQREKEKATLYTRNAMVDALGKDIKALVEIAVMAYKEMNNEEAEWPEVTVTFGEYANPSFESQVETISKAKTGGIMSTEAAVEELYGDARDKDWKAEEVARLKEEQGITTVEEPAVNMEAGGFVVNTGGEDGKADKGQSGETHVPDGQGGVSGTPEDRQ